MDLITINFIGIILFFQMNSGANPAKYTVLVADGTPAVTVCGTPLDEHTSFIRVIGTPSSENTWPVSSVTCTLIDAQCRLYELDHDDLFITTVSESLVGVTKDATLDRELPKLTKFFKAAKIDLSLAKSKANATLELTAGTLTGHELYTDQRTAKLVVKQGLTKRKTVTIQSRSRNLRIVVPAGSVISILNVPPLMGHHRLGVQLKDHDDDWYLHYTLADSDPRPSDCTDIPKTELAKLAAFNKKTHLTRRALNKACSATTYP